MIQVITTVFSELFGIIPRAIGNMWDAFCFPSTTFTPQEPSLKREKKKDGVIRSQQDDLSSMASESRSQDLTIGRQKLHIERLTKRLETLEKENASLRFKLREANSNYRRMYSIR